MRATLFPLAAIAVGLAGVAAAWRRPRPPAWSDLRDRLPFALVTAAVMAAAFGWRAGAAALIGAVCVPAAEALGPATASALALAGLGVAARLFLEFGYDEASWRAFAAVAAGLAAGVAGARPGGSTAATRLALHSAALSAAVAVGAASPLVANRPDAVALPAFLGAAAVAVAAVTAFARRWAADRSALRVAAAVAFSALAWWVAGRFDPVALRAANLPVRAAGPAIAALAGAAAGFATAVRGSPSLPGALRVAAPLAAVAAAVFAAHVAAGPYGVACAAVAALAVAALLEPAAGD